MSEPMIEVNNFRKIYGGYTAVDDISFSVYRSEIFSLLGPNGAGKTSTLEALEGLRSADGGTLRVGRKALRYEAANMKRTPLPLLFLLSCCLP